ncbi:hypothetical protein DUNSADRAFT_10222 [Dunaliella salina]|nr:hypothetical protein DUNSADRAFT_10222 [Dunaliella salina]|eukprot:KAF5833468.1 hypothetical protein DUNSADRAFT_10222 [Dunaliella salina]
MQLAEIRKLRAQVADLTAHADEVQVEERSKADKARQLLAEEVNRLTHDNKVMRTQLERVTMSVNEVIDKHTAHVSREEANREAMRIGIERSLGQQIEAAEKERVRQVDNLKQQSAHFLEQKSQEIFSLKSQMTQMRTEHELEAKQLHAEVDLLTTYAERVTELLQKMEAGAHGMVEMSGIRSLKVPHRDRPAGLDLEHLQQLRHCGDAVQRMLEMVRAAAAKPGSRPASARPGSRPASALVPSPTHTHAAAPAAAMKAGAALHRSAPSSAAAHPSSTRTQVPAHGAHLQTASALPVPALGSLPLPPGCTSLSSLPVHQQRLQNQQQRQDRGSEAEHGGNPGEQEKHQAVDGADANAEEAPNEKSLQYIRSLEEALAKQRAETFAERRRQGELTVALRSALRSARFPNPMQAALLNTPMGHSPHWGYGHNQLSNSLLNNGLISGLNGSLNNGLAEALTQDQAPSSWAAAPFSGSAWSVNRPASAGPSRSGGMSGVGAEGLGLKGRGSTSGSGVWRSRPLTASAAGARAAVSEGVLVQQW